MKKVRVTGTFIMLKGIELDGELVLCSDKHLKKVRCLKPGDECYVALINHTFNSRRWIKKIRIGLGLKWTDLVRNSIKKFDILIYGFQRD